jgi:predicted DNA-binding helix-hairpin-helix protein
MQRLHEGINEHKEARKNKQKINNQTRKKATFKFAPAGQSTQMIIGADNSNDSTILTTSDSLYSTYRMRRVYYSAFSPIPDASQDLPLKPPPLIREHRLYQADWLLRFYGFSVNEITPKSGSDKGMLDLEIDPKLSWAIRNRSIFPVNINRAPIELLLRIPGIGTKGAQRILQVRQWHALRLEDLAKLRISLKKVQPFIETIDYSPNSLLLEKDDLRSHFVQQSNSFNRQQPNQQQLELFAESA